MAFIEAMHFHKMRASFLDCVGVRVNLLLFITMIVAIETIGLKFYGFMKICPQK